MDSREVLQLVERCLPSFHEAGLPPLEAQDIADVKHKAIASLWAGMGTVFEITITSKAGCSPVSIMAKRVELPAQCSSTGDQRKKDSYAVEAAFYSQGHAQRLIAAGAHVPYPLFIDSSRYPCVTICMSRLEGLSRCRGDSAAFVQWLATMHATYWGSERADAAVATGLQAQGCDERPNFIRSLLVTLKAGATGISTPGPMNTGE
jgi:hypothetical protein